MNKNRFNLRNLVAIAICFVGTVTIFAQETGVVINDVKWATRNVGAPSAFVQNPEDYGGLYQWNKKDTVNYLLYDDYYASIYWNENFWQTENDPSPVGWRIPTFEEIQKLLDIEKVNNEWIIEGGVNGRKFTDKKNGNSIFLPASGYLDGIDGIFYYTSEYGFYWNNTVFEEDVKRAYALMFTRDIVGCGDGIKVNSTNIRPVSDDATKIKEISPNAENATIIGYYDVLGKKLNEEPTKGFYIIQYDNRKTKKIMKQ